MTPLRSVRRILVRRRTSAIDDIALIVPLLFVAAFFLYPLIGIVVESFEGAGPASTYAALVRDSLFVRSVGRTLLISFLAAGLCLLLGYPVAYHISRARTRRRAVLLGVIVVSLWLSSLVRTYAWLLLLQRTGPLNYLLVETGLRGEPATLVRNLPGILIGMTNILLPYVVLALVPVMRSVDPRVMLAAQSLGASKLRVIARIFLPLTAGGIAAAFLLALVLGLGFFLTPAILGGPSDLFISQLIARQIGRLGNLPIAAAMSVMLTMGVIAVYLLLSKLMDPVRFLGGRS
jgi:putative spermidine/putrescine transport system permease protein